MSYLGIPGLESCPEAFLAVVFLLNKSLVNGAEFIYSLE
jgi:hypothetical protein